MAAARSRKEEEDEMALEDGDIDESPRESFRDDDDSEDGDMGDEEEDERDEDGDGVGSFESRQWPQSYRYVRGGIL
jgi:vesicular inhibitory amino acid transporter